MGITSKLLTPDDVKRHAENPDYNLSTDLATRLTSGMDFCVGVFVNDDLASYAWFATQSIEAEHNRGGHPRTGVDLTFPSHMAFMYKGFTVPRYRGRGLYKTVPRYALELLADRGIGAILSTADWSNAAALASCTRVGFRPIGRVCVVGLASLVWRKRPAAARNMGICGGATRARRRTALS